MDLCFTVHEETVRTDVTTATLQSRKQTLKRFYKRRDAAAVPLKKPRMSGKLCQKCHQPQTKNTGHQWVRLNKLGKGGATVIYCPFSDGLFDDWKKKYD